MQELKARGTRKRSPRPSVHKGKQANLLKAYRLAKLWATPEYREKQTAARAAALERRRENPENYYRRGVPDGMRKAKADKLWAKARAKAEEIHAIMVKQGKVAPLPKDGEQVLVGKTVIVVPETDEQKASAALREAMVIALGPMNQASKMAALRTVLDFTKPKPVQRSEHKITNAEQWLDAVKADNESSRPATEGDA